MGTLCSFIYLVQALVSALNRFFQASFPNGVKSLNSFPVPVFLCRVLSLYWQTSFCPMWWDKPGINIWSRGHFMPERLLWRQWELEQTERRGISKPLDQGGRLERAELTLRISEESSSLISSCSKCMRWGWKASSSKHQGWKQICLLKKISACYMPALYPTKKVERRNSMKEHSLSK